MNNKNSKQQGITLVEVLVVISIVTILVGLLIPAVQMVRGSAQRLTCQEKLRQIAIATINFETTHSHVPASSFNARYDDVNYSSDRGTFVKILPMLESANVSEGISSLTFTFEKSNSSWYGKPNELFNCPSAGSPTSLKNISEYYGACPSSDVEAWTCDYVANGGAFSPRISDPLGWRPVFDVSVTGITSPPIDFNYVRKGLSNTLLYWESSGREMIIYENQELRVYDWNDLPENWGYNLFVFPASGVPPIDGWRPTNMASRQATMRSYQVSWAGLRQGNLGAWNTSDGNELGYDPPEGQATTINLGNTNGNLFSYHPAGSNFVFCDGVVTFLPNHTDSHILFVLSAINRPDIVQKEW